MNRVPAAYYYIVPRYGGAPPTATLHSIHTCPLVLDCVYTLALWRHPKTAQRQPCGQPGLRAMHCTASCRHTVLPDATAHASLKLAMTGTAHPSRRIICLLRLQF